MKIENSKYNELKKWYKKAQGLEFRRLINNEVLKLRETVCGNHILYIGLPEFKKKFELKNQLSYISFNDLSFDENLNVSKRLPFEDKSHDTIVLVHTLDYTQNPYELIREIDRIASDDAKVLMIGFNKTSLWGFIKPYMKQEVPWTLNFHSLYNINEWFKLLGYRSEHKETISFFPYIPKRFIKIVEKMGFLQRIFLKNFGGIYLYSFRKETIPVTPIKIKFRDKYVVTPFSKSTLNRIK